MTRCFSEHWQTLKWRFCWASFRVERVMSSWNTRSRRLTKYSITWHGCQESHARVGIIKREYLRRLAVACASYVVISLHRMTSIHGSADSLTTTAVFLFELSVIPGSVGAMMRESWVCNTVSEACVSVHAHHATWSPTWQCVFHPRCRYSRCCWKAFEGPCLSHHSP